MQTAKQATWRGEFGLRLFCVITFALFAGSASASDLVNAPPSFAFKNGMAVFIDIEKSSSILTLDGQTRSAVAKTVLTFRQETVGYPIFDLLENPTLAKIDGRAVDTEVIASPNNVTHYRTLSVALEAGSHVLEIEHPYERRISFERGGASISFVFADSVDRGYLEQNFPANLEFDSYPFDLTIEAANLAVSLESHDLFTNGSVNVLNPSAVKISFPSFYNSASFFLQMAPKGVFRSKTVRYRSTDGRELPVTVFKKSIEFDLDVFLEKTLATLDELEADYGPFPHDKVLVYAAYNAGYSKLDGMEYAGAVISNFSALDHELFHSYHARSVMPANGDSGWMDEAIAMWRDDRYPLLHELPELPPNVPRIGKYSPYSRRVNGYAYTNGPKLLSYFAARAADRGLSFKTFLRKYFERRKFTIVTSTTFRNDLIEFIGPEIAPVFDDWVFGGKQ